MIGNLTGGVPQFRLRWAAVHALFAGTVLAAALSYPSAMAAEAGRVAGGLVALYDFRSGEGEVVRDVSGAGEPLDLEIGDTSQVRWAEGGLEITGATQIASDGPAQKVIDAVRRSGAVTVEAWVTPADTDQAGPARIVTLSKDSGSRNLTLGQDGDKFDGRFRASGTGDNGVPSLGSEQGSAKAALTHVVFTRNRGGGTRFFVDGKLAGKGKAEGGVEGWAPFRLALGDEFGGGRPWRGRLHLVALYRRPLSPREVAQHFDAGPHAGAPPAETTDRSAELFASKIAPILAEHCLECHDSANNEGKLDLSRKAAALAGTPDGPVIVAGDPEASELWHVVESDEMPEDRTPLSAEEKAALREWIAAGAAWPVDVVDPLAHKVDQRATERFVRRLTTREYIESVRAATGVDIADEAHAKLPRDLRADGFANTAYNLTVDFAHVGAYGELAATAVSRMDVPAFIERFAKGKKRTDEGLRDFVAAAGQWVLRGPLEEHEVTSYCGVATTVASAGGKFDEAAALIVEAMLQSPRFLYRVENQRGDGTAWPAGDFELASRLSYFIWGAPPDRELVGAAEDGKLGDPDELRRQVGRMLDDDRAVEQSVEFISQWLDLDRLADLQPSPEKFPGWNPWLAADMRGETVAFFREVAWGSDRPLSDLLNAQFTFTTPRLAAHYGFGDGAADLEEELTGDELSRVDLTAVPGRGGLLTHGSVLTVGGDDASMVTRGLFVLHDLLRSGVKDPPPGTDTTPVPSKPGLTQRAVAEKRIADKSCGGCHGKFEPLAFGLERFDGLGTYREVDEFGNTLRDDGEIFFPGEGEPVAYGSSAELMDLLAGSARVQETLTWRLAQFAVGRPLTAADAPVLAEVHARAQEAGGTYPALATAIATSDLFTLTRTEATP